MKMDFLQSAGLGIVAAVICLLLKQYRPEFALVAAVACGALLLLSVVSALSPVFSAMEELVEQTGVTPAYLQLVLKAFGICYLAQLAADTCRDAGQTAIAGKVELAGRAAVLVLSLPLFMEIAQTAVSLLQGI